MAKQTIDCAVVIALREEFLGNGSLHGFEGFFDIDAASTGEAFQHFHFTDSGGTRRFGIVVVMEEVSPLSAYATSRDLLDVYEPALLVNIGIAGALSKDLRLGDVVVADEVDLYDYRGKAVPSNDSLSDFTFRWGGKSFNPSSDVMDVVARLWQQKKPFEQWQNGCLERLMHCSAASSINDLKQGGYLRDLVRIERGRIASGNVVSASSAFRRSLLDSHARTLMAIEMESGGVLRATAKSECRSLVIKAISDLADENKAQLDEATGDCLRAWAMSNALQILSIACRSAISFDRKQPANTVLVTNKDFSVKEEREKLMAFSKKHFKKQHHSLVQNVDQSLVDFDSLFRPIIRFEGLTQSNLFLDVARMVLESSHSYPLRVDGKPGTGKTTFLTLLTLAFYKLGESIPGVAIPIFINLRRYTTPERGRERDWNPNSEAEDDLAVLRRILGSDSSPDVVIIVDGVDEYVRHDDAIEAQLLDLIQESSSAKKIVGVGVNYLADRERFKRKLRNDLTSPESKILLEAVSINDKNAVDAFIQAFRKTYLQPTPADIGTQILGRAATFRLDSLDLLLLSMLVDELMNRNRYAGVGNLGSFFRIYCEHFLSTPAGNEALDDAAELAFNYTVRPHYKPTDDSIGHSRAWKLLHLHPTIRDFLVAWYTVNLIRRVGDPSTKLKPEDLEYVYPHNINRFGKDIVNTTRDAQFEVINGAKSLFKNLGQGAKPHAVYLAGRVEDSEAKHQAKLWLQNECLPEVMELQKQPDSKLSPGELLLCRTVYISLAYLEDREASEAYIKLLLERAAWNDINRGFHLEYYGDIPFDPERQLSHLDNLAPFPRTFANLYGRILTGLKSNTYGLLDIEIFTLFSLAQYRYVTSDRLPQDIRSRLLDLIPSLVASRKVGDDVREYVKMLGINLKQARPYLPANLVERLYGLKTQTRAGWVDRNLPLKRVESVAEHTMGALILGIVFLPEENPRGWVGYDKAQVLAYLMIHDLAESIAGDASPLDLPRARVSKDKERDAFKYLMMSRTYRGISDLARYYRQWKAFEDGANENARIARDLDKLENLTQLYLYQREVDISDHKSWQDALKESISTEIGEEILSHLRDYFESGDPV